jgi:hypothetical protein
MQKEGEQNFMKELLKTVFLLAFAISDVASLFHAQFSTLFLKHVTCMPVPSVYVDYELA